MHSKLIILKKTSTSTPKKNTGNLYWQGGTINIYYLKYIHKTIITLHSCYYNGYGRILTMSTDIQFDDLGKNYKLSLCINQQKILPFSRTKMS